MESGLNMSRDSMHESKSFRLRDYRLEGKRARLRLMNGEPLRPAHHEAVRSALGSGDTD
jgi:hypothetical protein